MSSSPVSGRRKPWVRRAVSRLGLLAVLAAVFLGAKAEPPTPLHDGLTLGREIRSGETHAYLVDLQAGQYLRVVLQEDGIDLFIRLLGPDRTVASGSDGLVGGTEDFAGVAEVSGSFQVAVGAPPKKGAQGRYRLRVEGPRGSKPEDRSRAEAVRIFWEATHDPDGKSRNPNPRDIPVYEKVLALWQPLGEPRRTAEILFILGLARSGSEVAQAAEEFRRAACLWGQLGAPVDRPWQVEALNRLGRNLNRLSRWDEAGEVLSKALEIARELDDPTLLQPVLNNLGVAYSASGEIPRAIPILRQSVEYARKVKDPFGEASALINLCAALADLAESQKALECYGDALDLTRAKGNDPDNQAAALNNLGNLYDLLGDWEKSAEYYQEALELNRRGDDREREAATLNNLAVIYERLERPGDALKTYGDALRIAEEIAEETKGTGLQSQILTNRSTLQAKSGRLKEATADVRKALDLAGGNQSAEADARMALRLIARKERRFQDAEDETKRALEIIRKRGDRNGEANTLLAWARVKRDLGDFATARTLAEEAVDLVEDLRTRVASQDLRTSFLASKQSYYEVFVATLMDLHKSRPGEGFAVDAFRASERARARSLLETLAEAGADLREGASQALIDRERELREEIRSREWRRLNLVSKQAGPGQLAEAERRIREALEEFRDVQTSLRESSPRYAALTQPEPLDVRQVQEEVLDDEAVLLEYSLGDERSYLFVVGPRSLETFELPGRKAVEEAARRYYELVTARITVPNEDLPIETEKKKIALADAETPQAAQSLAKIILGPAEKSLTGRRTLLVVADGALQYVPFAALPLASGEPLASRFEVVSLPSASVLAVLRRDTQGRAKPPKTLAVLADPVFQPNDSRFLSRREVLGGKPAPADATAQIRGERLRDEVDPSKFRRLSFSAGEAKTLAALLPPDQVFTALGFDATRELVTGGRLAGYRNVHFATHGFVDSQHPELSGLVLSMFDKKGTGLDGILRLNDVYNLNLDADLVVLSACRTALGKEVRGEGLIGLTRGFMYAGSARVLASLWSVEDRATADLMGSFYRGMLRENLSPAAALRKAQLEMAKDPKRKSPYFWAGFSLQGEWR